MDNSINKKGLNYKTATLKYALSSFKKMELVSKLVRGKNVDQAINILMFTPKKSAKILLKVLKSAVSNYKSKESVSESDLYISKVDIGQWPKMKRIKYVWRSRVHPFNKYRSIVRVVLDNK